MLVSEIYIWLYPFFNKFYLKSEIYNLNINSNINDLLSRIVNGGLIRVRAPVIIIDVLTVYEREVERAPLERLRINDL